MGAAEEGRVLHIGQGSANSLRPIGSVDSKSTSSGGSIPEVHLLGSSKAIGIQTIWSPPLLMASTKTAATLPVSERQRGRDECCHYTALLCHLHVGWLYSREALALKDKEGIPYRPK